MDDKVNVSGGPDSNPAPPPSAGVHSTLLKPLDQPGLTHREFLERALIAVGEWTRYADAKALGVLVLLGLGVADLFDHAGRLLHPHDPAAAKCSVVGVTGHTCAGIGATASFVVACVLAAFVVGFVTHALFSRMTLRGLLGHEKRQEGIKSKFFFAEVRRYGSQEAYAQAVLSAKSPELLRDVAGQVYEVSKVCHIKHLASQRAFALTLLFLVAWAAARILLAAG